MMSSPCQIFLTKGVPLPTCTAFADGSVNQGMSVGLARFYENFRGITLMLAGFTGSANTPFTQPIVYQNITGDKQRDNIYNVRNTKEATENRFLFIYSGELILTYVKKGFQYLMNEFDLSLKKKFTEAENLKVALLIVFLILLTTLYMVAWLSFLAKLSREVLSFL